jgi:hypothetical protein
MAIRRVKRFLGYSIPRGEFFATIAICGEPDEPVTIRYYRHLAGKIPLLWRKTEANAMDVTPEEGLAAENLASGKVLAKEILTRLVEGEIAYRECPHVPAPKPTLVREIEHSTKMLRSAIYQWPSEFEIRVYGMVPNGSAMPAQSPSISHDPDFEWGHLTFLEKITAETLQEARIVAEEEMIRYAVGNICVKDRV